MVIHDKIVSCLYTESIYSGNFMLMRVLCITRIYSLIQGKGWYALQCNRIERPSRSIFRYCSRNSSGAKYVPYT